jgi:glycerol kinase
MLNTLRVPVEIMPEVFPSSNIFGHYNSPTHGTIPIAAILGDQQSALFGQCCFTSGMAKNTYGTGCFMLMNTGAEIPSSNSGLLNTIAWQIGDKTTYALEGSVFIAGAAVQWLKNGIEIIDDISSTSEIASREAKKNPDSSVVVVPAFAGLGTPYWDMHARGAILGLTRDSGQDSIIRATLESIAFRSKDVLDAMQEDSGISLFALKVDGGASVNDYLMQFQSDILGVSVERLSFVESTAAGVAYMAALTIGELTLNEISKLPELERSFDPEKSLEWREGKKAVWSKAIERIVL